MSHPFVPKKVNSTHVLPSFHLSQFISTLITFVGYHKHYKTELELESNISTSENPSRRESMSTVGNDAAALSTMIMAGGAGVGAGGSAGASGIESVGAGVGSGGEKNAAGPRSGGEKKEAAPGAGAIGGVCTLLVFTNVPVALIAGTTGTTSCCT